VPKPTYDGPELLSDSREEELRLSLLSIVALVATNLRGLRLLLPDRVRVPSLRRNTDSVLAHSSARIYLFDTRAFKLPVAQMNPCNELQTSVGIFSSITTKLDDRIAALVSELLLLLLVLLTSTVYHDSSPKRCGCSSNAFEKRHASNRTTEHTYTRIAQRKVAYWW